MGFVRDLVRAGSVGFVETAIEHVGLLFSVKKAGARRFIIRCACKQPIFFEISGWTVAHRGGTLPCRISGAPEDAQNWFVGSAEIKNTFHQMRFSGWLQLFFFAFPAVLASEVGYVGKTIDQTRLAPILLHVDMCVSLPLPKGFSGAKFFCQGVTGYCKARKWSRLCKDNTSNDPFSRLT